MSPERRQIVLLGCLATERRGQQSIGRDIGRIAVFQSGYNLVGQPGGMHSNFAMMHRLQPASSSSSPARKRCARTAISMLPRGPTTNSLHRISCCTFVFSGPQALMTYNDDTAYSDDTVVMPDLIRGKIDRL